MVVTVDSFGCDSSMWDMSDRTCCKCWIIFVHLLVVRAHFGFTGYEDGVGFPDWFPYYCPPKHRRLLPVLHYTRNMVIYHYPLIGVIYMVFLHVFIIKNHPNLFSNYYPKSKIWVIYPLSLNITRLYESKQQCYLILVSCFW